MTDIHDAQLEDIFGEVDILIRKHRAATSNEVLAIIAFDAFNDACDAWDIPAGAERRRFVERYPVLSEYV